MTDIPMTPVYRQPPNQTHKRVLVGYVATTIKEPNDVILKVRMDPVEVITCRRLKRGWVIVSRT